MSLPDSNCEKCQLFQTCKTPFMSGHGDDSVVLVIGEAPGEEEDRQGIPFVGRSGQLLCTTLHEFFDTDTVRFTNIVRCRPPGNKVTKKAINLCKHNVLDEIEECDPDLVLLLGNVPLNAMLGESGITNWNGVVVERDDRIYVPLFHPAYILRNRAATDEWLQGFLNAEAALDSGAVGRADTLYEYIYPETVAEVRAMSNHILGQALPDLAFDTETASLDAYASDNVVLACSFATADKAYAVPLSHPDAVWTASELEDIISIISRILECRKIVGHNIKFDQQQWFAYADNWFDAAGDTMLVSHLLDSRKGIHGLKRLAGLHLGMYDYDDGLKTYYSEHPKADVYKGGTYAAVPLDILLPYAAMDAVATYLLWCRLYEDLSLAQKLLLKDLVMSASDALAGVEDNGIAVDGYIADRYVRVYSSVNAELLDDISNDVNVKELVGDRQAKLDVEHKLHPRRARKYFQFNPNSPPQLRELYYTYGSVPVPSEKTNTGLPTTKASVLSRHEKNFPIVRDIRYYKLFTKMLGTYLRPAATGKWASGDDRVRCSFNLHGTRTGRLSSSQPNLQNIPTPEKEPGTLLEHLPIKNIFTHTFPGGALMSADYSGMELRVFASLANCTPMLEIHESGVDFHTMVASMVSGIPYDAIDKPTRYIYKWTNWTLLYGGGASALHKMYDIPMDEARYAVKTYYERFPQVLDYQDECVEFAKAHGYIESPFGRREHLPYINDGDSGYASKARRSAVNMPVQSAASDITLMALVIIDRALRQDGCQTMIVNTVHDSIVLDVHPDETDHVARTCVTVMEDIVDLAGFYMPHLDMSWVKCPFKADIEVGTHYGNLEKYEKE